MTVKYDLNIEGSWHKVCLNYSKGLLTLNVDDKNKTTFLNGIQHFLADQTITIGSGIGGKGNFGNKIKTERNIYINLKNKIS